MKKIVSLTIAFLLLFSSVDILSITKVFASEINVIVSNEDFTKILTVDSDNSLYVNGNKVEPKWKREYYFSDSGAYTNRVQELQFNSTNLDLNNITFGTYKSDYTGEIEAFRVKVIDPLYMYHYSKYQSGSMLENTFIDCRGKITPRYLDVLDPDDAGYLIINADSGKVEDFYSNLNFYYCNNIDKPDFNEKGVTKNNPILPVIEEKPVIQDIIATNNSLEVLWSAVPFATSYEIEVDGQSIEKSQSNKILDGNLSPVSEHTYRVRAINANSVSEWSNSLTATTLLDIPSNISAQSTSDSITLDWDAVNSANKYEIKLDNSIYQTSDTNYTISGLSSGAKHTYQVRAINDLTQSEWSASKDWYTLPKLPTNVTAIESNNNVKFAWTASAGSTGYDISVDDKIVSTTYLTYTYNLSSKGPHIYKIRSKNSAGVGEWVIPNVSAASPTASNISVINNKAGIDDVITVLGVVEDDIVKVYNTQTGGTLIGETVVPTGKSDAKIEISQLGATSGNIYVSIHKPGTNESARVAQSYLSEASPALSASNIIVTNNYEGTNDTVTVNGLLDGDIINLYNAATGGNLIGTGVVTSGNNSLVIDVPQLGSSSGTVYVSVTKVNKLESARVAKGYSSEPTTTAPVASTITITNNKLGIDDKVTVTGLVENDVITIYNALTGGVLIGSGTVENGETTLNLSIPQLGAAGGTLYFTKKSEGKLESSRTAKGFESETSPILSSNNITVVNNYVGTDDTVTVNGISEGDVINIYTASTGGNLVATGTVSVGNTTITISVPQLSSMAGTIYVSVTKVNKLESARQSKSYATEPTTTAPLTSSITVTNNKAGIDDTVKVSGLVEGDVVSVYNALSGGIVLGTATVGALETSKTFIIPQLGAVAGNVYVTIKKDGKLESARTAQTYTSETSPTLSASNVTITNNYVGTDDTVSVTGLVEGDIITVYDALTNGNVISSGTVSIGNTSLTLSIPQLGSTSGTVYISVTKYNKLESARLSKAYLTEPTTTAPTASSISVVNNKVGIDDTVVVSGLVEGDVITVYSAATGGTILGSAIVAQGETSKTFVITQLGSGSGNVYVTIKKDGKLESARTTQSYTSETSPTLSASNVTITNNYVGTDDTVSVTGLVEGDIITVYDALTNGNVISSGTVSIGNTSLTLSIPQLGSTSGTVYITVIKYNKLESARLSKVYSTEPTTTAPTASSISVVNNKVGIDDTVVVSGLVEGDLVTIYNAATGGTVLGSSTVEAGETIKTFNIAQLGAGTGSVYVTVKKDGKLESTRTAKSYTSETSPTLATSNVTIVNNYVGTDDTVTVNGLTAGDIITIYNAATGGNVIGTGTVENGKTTITLSIPQLSSVSGTAYISITNENKLESARLAKTYASEPTTTAPIASSIAATNNKAGIDDTVVVSGLVPGDIVTVYSSATGGTILGSAVVETGETSKTIMIPQLGTGTGSVYVTVKKDGKLESTRTAQTFTSETTTTISTSYITIVNNYVGTEDTVTVTNLAAGDLINVYDAVTGGNLIGTGTVASGNTAVSIAVPQIGSAAGTLYVTVTKLNKLESARMSKAYLVEPTTQQLSPAAITVTNNKIGTDDTIVVTGLVEGDLITVYNSAGTTVLGTGTVAAGQTTITITVPQLSTTAGSIQVSNKKVGKHESTRTGKFYIAEV